MDKFRCKYTIFNNWEQISTVMNASFYRKILTHMKITILFIIKTFIYVITNKMTKGHVPFNPLLPEFFFEVFRDIA